MIFIKAAKITQQTSLLITVQQDTSISLKAFTLIIAQKEINPPNSEITMQEIACHVDSRVTEI